MDLGTSFSAAHILDTETMKDTVEDFEAYRISHYWYTDAVHADKSFSSGG